MRTREIMHINVLSPCPAYCRYSINGSCAYWDHSLLSKQNRTGEWGSSNQFLLPLLRIRGSRDLSYGRHWSQNGPFLWPLGACLSWRGSYFSKRCSQEIQTLQRAAASGHRDLPEGGSLSRNTFVLVKHPSTHTIYHMGVQELCFWLTPGEFMIKVENKNKCKSRKHTHMWFNYLGSEYM